MKWCNKGTPSAAPVELKRNNHCWCYDNICGLTCRKDEKGIFKWVWIKTKYRDENLEIRFKDETSEWIVFYEQFYKECSMLPIYFLYIITLLCKTPL